MVPSPLWHHLYLLVEVRVLTCFFCMVGALLVEDLPSLQELVMTEVLQDESGWTDDPG